MTLLKVILLAIIQGLAELLPVSSSAHVVVAEKLMGLNPSSPEMTLLLVMLHSGTMLAVIVYFWKVWKKTYFSSWSTFRQIAGLATWATVLTGVVGEFLKKTIQRTLFHRVQNAEIEQLFGRLDLIAPALTAVGLLILIAGLLQRRNTAIAEQNPDDTCRLTFKQAGWMGIVQGFALPFRGFSRSGSTISAGILSGASKQAAEHFSFALAVVLTPVVVAMESIRLLQASHGISINFGNSIGLSLMGAGFSFLAGLIALKWLSTWLEADRWYLFGIYCLIASAIVFYLHSRGF